MPKGKAPSSDAVLMSCPACSCGRRRRMLWKPGLQFTCPRCHFAASDATMNQSRNSSGHRREMIRPLLISIASWLFFALPAIGADIDAASINHAEFDASKPASEGKIDAVVVQVQVLLDRARFSLGEIDGKLGENAQKALKAFGEAKGLRVNNALTPEVWKALVATSSDAAVGEYRVSKDDLKGPFLQKLPAKMEEMKSLPFLGYTNPREAIAEKFHMSERSSLPPSEARKSLLRARSNYFPGFNAANSSSSGTLKVVSSDAIRIIVTILTTNSKG